MSEHLPTPVGVQQTYERIKAILSEARTRAYRAINTAMVAVYWEIGRVIVEQEQQGQQRAEYGRALLEELSRRLKSEFGKGFDPSHLARMRAFYLLWPILDALRQELSWTHYRLLLRVERPEALSKT
jgi:AcrR family transcriptional regulator